MDSVDNDIPFTDRRTPCTTHKPSPAATSPLRYWRGRRGLSQLRGAVDADISQRHLSFLETGKAQPGRDLVLDIPLHQRNAMLLAASFAPAYRERSLSDPDRDAVKRALDFMLAQAAPYPALVVDRLWNLVMFNAPAARMMRHFLGMPADAPIPRDGSIDVLKLTLDPGCGWSRFSRPTRPAAIGLMVRRFK